MQYLLSFIEGIFMFISPCLLPMLPLYVSYFAGDITDGVDKGKKSRALIGSIGFVLGFTLVFVSLGAFAGTLGRVLIRYQTAFNIITGGVVIVFGLHYLGVLKIKLLNVSKKFTVKKTGGFFKSVIFGIVFSIGWTPCAGAFLGSALMLAAQSATSAKGIIMLLLFSAGLGIPFIISALLIENLKTAFDFIKRHYKVINAIAGILLIITGIFMATGTMGYLLSLISF